MSFGVYVGSRRKGGVTKRVITLSKYSLFTPPKLESKGNLLIPKFGFSGCLVGDYIYTFDGRRSTGNHINAAEKYNIKTGISTEIATTIRPLTDYTCLSNGVDIWFFAGVNIYDMSTASFLVYNIAKNSYTILPDVPYSTSYPAVLFISASEVLFTGHDSLTDLKVYLYNTSTNSWSVFTSNNSPIALYAATPFLYNNKVYYFKDNKIYVLDLSTKTWATLTPVLIDRSWQFILRIENIVYIAGGSKNGKAVASVESYNLDTGEVKVYDTKYVSCSKFNGFAAANDANGFIIGGYPINDQIEVFTPPKTGKSATISILEPSVIRLDKSFYFNSELKNANVDHSLQAGILEIAENETSGTITETITGNITI